MKKMVLLITNTSGMSKFLTLHRFVNVLCLALLVAILTNLFWSSTNQPIEKTQALEEVAFELEDGDESIKLYLTLGTRYEETPNTIFQQLGYALIAKNQSNYQVLPKKYLLFNQLKLAPII